MNQKFRIIYRICFSKDIWFGNESRDTFFDILDAANRYLVWGVEPKLSWNSFVEWWVKQ